MWPFSQFAVSVKFMRDVQGNCKGTDKSVVCHLSFVSCTSCHLKFILIIKQLYAQNLFYNKFISCLYMFRTPFAHRQEVKIVLYSIWYHHTYRWPSCAQVERGLSQPVHRTATYRCDNTRCCIIKF